MMSSGLIQTRWSSPARGSYGPTVVIAIVVACLSAAGVATAMASQQPILAFGFALAAPVTCAILCWPNVITYMVIFLVYINFPVIAMRFHGVPYVVCAAIPGLLLIPVIYHVIVRRQKLILAPVLPLIALFLVIQTIGTLFSEKSEIAFNSLIVTVVEGLILFLLITNAVRTKDQLHKVVWALLAAGAFMGGLTFFQQTTRTYDKNYGGFAQVQSEGFQTGTAQGQARQPRLSGPIGVENRYAQIMLMIVPLGLFQMWGGNSSRLRLLAIIATGLTVLGWALAFSRGSAVGFVLMLIVMSLLGCIKPRHLAVIGIGAVLLLITLPQYRTRLAKILTVSSFVTGSGTVADEPDNAIKGRMTSMLAAVRVFANHPVVGVGPGVFKYYSREYGREGGLRDLEGNRESHNLYLGIAAENGLLGLTCFLAILGLTLRDLLRVREHCLQTYPGMASLAAGFILAVTVYMTTGIFAHISHERYFWLVLALASSAIYIGNTYWKTSNESVICNPSI